MFGLSTLNLKKLVNQAFSKPSWTQSKNIFKHFFCFSFFILEHLEINERLLEQHCQKNMIAWQLLCSKQTCQNIASYSERGKSQNNGLRTGALFFSSPHLPLHTKCCVCLAWLLSAQTIFFRRMMGTSLPLLVFFADEGSSKSGKLWIMGKKPVTSKLCFWSSSFWNWKVTFLLRLKMMKKW